MAAEQLIKVKETQKLGRNFFTENSVSVARQSLGKLFFLNGKTWIINETEAYRQENDPACHAAKGITKRNAPMFKTGGHLYVYLIYGMYYCLNIVTENEGYGSAILIRSVLDPEAIIPDSKLSGPGKLCRELGIDLSFNNIDLCNSNKTHLSSSNLIISQIEESCRIGISKGKDLPWRFRCERSNLIL